MGSGRVYYEVSPNPIVTFIQQTIDFLIGLVILALLLSAIWFTISYIYKNTVSFIGALFNIFRKESNVSSHRINRTALFKEEEKKDTKIDINDIKPKREHKNLVNDEYAGLTPDEIEKEMNKKY